jgi:hypothetical protein
VSVFMAIYYATLGDNTSFSLIDISLVVLISSILRFWSIALWILSEFLIYCLDLAILSVLKLSGTFYFSLSDINISSCSYYVGMGLIIDKRLRIMRSLRVFLLPLVVCFIFSEILGSSIYASLIVTSILIDSLFYFSSLTFIDDFNFYT